MARRTQVKIEMPDGVELSATLFFPDAGHGPPCWTRSPIARTT